MDLNTIGLFLQFYQWVIINLKQKMCTKENCILPLYQWVIVNLKQKKGVYRRGSACRVSCHTSTGHGDACFSVELAAEMSDTLTKIYLHKYNSDNKYYGSEGVHTLDLALSKKFSLC
jgi:hypothetical protein